LTTFTTEDKEAIKRGLQFFKELKEATPRDRKGPMTFAEVQELFDVALTTTDANTNPSKLIEFVRKVERFHNIG
jgi:hypothetical protein